jgi:biotin carboxylase
MSENVLIFGGGLNQISLIKAVNKLGYCSVTIDPNPDAIGKKNSQIFYRVDGNDYETTKRIAVDHNIKGIVSGQMEKPMKLMSRLAQEMGYIYHSPEVVEKATNKYLMKQSLIANKVPTAKGKLFHSKSELKKELLEELKYPVIIKPKDSFSSRGVYKVKNYEEIFQFIDETISFSSDGSFLVEEFLEGPEFSIESITYNGITEIIQYTEKFITPYPNTVEIGHLQPAPFTEYDRKCVDEVVKNGIKALGINNSASHAEIKLTKSGPFIIEIGARLGGDFISSYLTQASTGYSMDEAVVQIAIGEKPANINKSNNDYSFIKYLVLEQGKKIQGIQNWDDIINDPDVVFANVFFEKDYIIPPITNSALRPACFIVKGKSRDKVISLGAEIENKFKSKFILV